MNVTLIDIEGQKPLPFFAAFAAADNAARILKQQKPDSSMLVDEVDRKCRMILRENAVYMLRWLWKTGDASQRTTVAARVAVWMGRKVETLHPRIRAREEARLSKTILPRG